MDILATSLWRRLCDSPEGPDKNGETFYAPMLAALEACDVSVLGPLRDALVSTDSSAHILVSLMAIDRSLYLAAVNVVAAHRAASVGDRTLAAAEAAPQKVGGGVPLVYEPLVFQSS
jgi:hypothetical protein